MPSAVIVFARRNSGLIACINTGRETNSVRDELMSPAVVPSVTEYGCESRKNHKVLKGD